MIRTFRSPPGFHAVVIGGAGDIGAATGKQFCDLGATVTATAANEADLARTLLEARPGLTLSTIDVTNDEAVASFARGQERIIVSMNATLALRRIPAYCASKGGVVLP